MIFFPFSKTEHFKHVWKNILQNQKQDASAFMPICLFYASMHSQGNALCSVKAHKPGRMCTDSPQPCAIYQKVLLGDSAYVGTYQLVQGL